MQTKTNGHKLNGIPHRGPYLGQLNLRAGSDFCVIRKREPKDNPGILPIEQHDNAVARIMLWFEHRPATWISKADLAEVVARVEPQSISSAFSIMRTNGYTIYARWSRPLKCFLYRCSDMPPPGRKFSTRTAKKKAK